MSSTVNIYTIDLWLAGVALLIWIFVGGSRPWYRP